MTRDQDQVSPSQENDRVLQQEPLELPEIQILNRSDEVQTSLLPSSPSSSSSSSPSSPTSSVCCNWLPQICCLNKKSKKPLSISCSQEPIDNGEPALLQPAKDAQQPNKPSIKEENDQSVTGKSELISENTESQIDETNSQPRFTASSTTSNESSNAPMEKEEPPLFQPAKDVQQPNKSSIKEENDMLVTGKSESISENTESQSDETISQPTFKAQHTTSNESPNAPIDNEEPYLLQPAKDVQQIKEKNDQSVIGISELISENAESQSENQPKVPSATPNDFKEEQSLTAEDKIDILIRQLKIDFAAALTGEMEDRKSRQFYSQKNLIDQLKCLINEQRDQISTLKAKIQENKVERKEILLLQENEKQTEQIKELETEIEKLKRNFHDDTSKRELAELKESFQELRKDVNEIKEIQARSQAEAREFHTKVIDLLTEQRKVSIPPNQQPQLEFREPQTTLDNLLLTNANFGHTKMKDEEIRFFVLRQLLQYSTGKVVAYLQKFLPKDPKELYKWFKNNEQLIDTLMSKRILRKPQRAILLPKDGSNETHWRNFDMTLLKFVIKRFIPTDKPSKFWDNEPKPDDQSIEAHIARLLVNRNDIAHATPSSLSDTEFVEISNSLINSLVALGGDRNEIENFITSTFQKSQPVVKNPVENIDTDKTDKLPSYKMSSVPRGICLIISNGNFEQARNNIIILDDRKGTDKDVELLKATFTDLKFQIEDQRDVTKDGMLSLIKKYSQETNHDQMDCFVCCIMTHGRDDGLYGVDGRFLRIPEILKMFETTRSLEGKPKLFFFQSCRRESSTKIATEDGRPKTICDNTNATAPYIPQKPGADFLVGYATVPGQAAHLTAYGSYYMTMLCKVLAEDASNREINEICLRVNFELSEHPELQQTATFRNALHGKLYFFPDNFK